VVLVVSSVTLSPFIGYKATSLVGLTFNTQLGIGARVRQGGALGNALSLKGTSQIRPFLLWNLNLGWSFGDLRVQSEPEG
jgi:hypothetical protein